MLMYIYLQGRTYYLSQDESIKIKWNKMNQPEVDENFIVIIQRKKTLLRYETISEKRLFLEQDKTHAWWIHKYDHDIICPNCGFISLTSLSLYVTI